jgi:hypothetical protein
MRHNGYAVKRLDDGARHESALRGCVDHCATIARLKAIPAKLRVIATLDPDPSGVRGQLCAIGLHFRRTRETIASTNDFRHSDLQQTEIDIARVRTADHNEACESGSVFTRER